MFVKWTHVEQRQLESEEQNTVASSRVKYYKSVYPLKQPKTLIGLELRKARVDKSLVEMAAVLKVNKNTLAAYERGERMPSFEFLIAFTKASKTSPKILFDAFLKDKGLKGVADLID